MSATSLRFGRAEKYVGERCNMVMCAQSSAIAGIIVAAVAPEPMTTTFLSA